MMSSDTNCEVDKDWEEDTEHIPFQYSMTSYGADFTVDGIVNKITKKDIEIPTFQRGFVWSFLQSSRFIESLLMGLPVPGIFLSREFGTQKLLVIDGQQRLRTLQYFYSGLFPPTGKEFVLKGVQPQFEGRSIKTITDEDRRFLDDSVIHATVVKQEKPEEDNSSIYYVFERLNTGGTFLTPQEIRHCVFQGELNELICKLNDNSKWRMIFGKVNKRMRDQELILRFFAFYYKGKNYSRPMRLFLNKYMGYNRHTQFQSEKELTSLFESMIDTVYDALGKNVFRVYGAINAAVFDSVGVGIATRLQKGPINDKNALKERYIRLLESRDFQDLVTVATADEKTVFSRINKAIEAFADLK
jgi:hypothetical protein